MQSQQQTAVYRDYWDRQADRADAQYAAPWRAAMKAKYQSLGGKAASRESLLALARECRTEQRHAANQANKYANMTRHGTHPYDAWSALYDSARGYAEQFEAKARATA